MSPPRLSFTREEIFKVVGVIALCAGAWYGVEARVQRIEEKQADQSRLNRENREDIQEIRRDVKDIMRSVARIEQKS